MLICRNILVRSKAFSNTNYRKIPLWDFCCEMNDEELASTSVQTWARLKSAMQLNVSNSMQVCAWWPNQGKLNPSLYDLT